MTVYEYKVVPAPVKGLRARGLKGTNARFANALQTLMNDLGSDGWEYLRADTLPAEERQGLTSKITVFQNMLVFRRQKAGEATSVVPQTQPDVVAPAPEPRALPAPARASSVAAAPAPEAPALADPTPEVPALPKPPQRPAAVLHEGRDFGPVDVATTTDEETQKSSKPDASFFSTEPLITAAFPKPRIVPEEASVTPLFPEKASAETNLPRPSPILAARAARLRAQATAAE